MASAAWADTLELKNGSRINGRFLGGTETDISFQVGSTVQKYNLADIISLKFDSDNAVSAPAPQTQGSLPDDPGAVAHVDGAFVNGSASRNEAGLFHHPGREANHVRTIDAIDSTNSFVGDSFQASLEEPLDVGRQTIGREGCPRLWPPHTVEGVRNIHGQIAAPPGVDRIVVNGKMVPVVTGEYEAIGRSRGASTAKRTVGGAALGAIIGAVADGGQGAAIGAGVGAGAGAGSEIIVGGDQVKVPSETLLDFTLLQEVSIPTPQS